MIEQMLAQLSMLDSNNFPHNVGVGEREARIYSGLVRRRHHGLGHGVGRSGDLCASQPKAVGSSLLYQLTCRLALDVIRAAGLPSAAAVVVLPCATGLTLQLTVAALARQRPNTHLVVWSRCDQRSCLKAIHTAGLTPVVVEGLLSGDEVVTDVAAIERLLADEQQRSDIRAVVTTTSCFAPRACDDVEKVATLCRRYSVPHLINNAYGVQSTKLMHRIKEAARLGRVDGVIQSTDKNFMVPVGGAVLVSFDKAFAKCVGETYPGRASASPVTDLFITLLSMGRSGYTELTKQRNALKRHLDTRLQEVAQQHGLRVLHTPENPISCGLALPQNVPSSSATALGSMLFTRGVSGARVVAPGKQASVADTNLTGWGSHHSVYPVAYLTAAASIGMTQEDVDTFVFRLDSCLKDWRKRGLDSPATRLQTAGKGSPSPTAELDERESGLLALESETDLKVANGTSAESSGLECIDSRLDCVTITDDLADLRNGSS